MGIAAGRARSMYAFWAEIARHCLACRWRVWAMAAACLGCVSAHAADFAYFQYRAWNEYGDMVADGTDLQKSYGAALARIQALGPRWENASDIGIVSEDGRFITIVTPFHGIDHFMTVNADPSGQPVFKATPTATCVAWLAGYGAVFLRIQAEFPGHPATGYGCFGRKPGAEDIGTYMYPACIAGFELSGNGGVDVYGRTIPGGSCVTRAAAQIIASVLPCPTCDERAGDRRIGNPIDPAFGIKRQYEPVIANLPGSGLGFDLDYSSERMDTPVRRAGWSHRYLRRLVVSSQVIQIYGGEARPVRFALNGSGDGYSAQADVAASLVKLKDGAGNHTDWRYTSPADDVESYDIAGYLTQVSARGGMVLTMTYDAGRRLTRVADPFARTLQFGYDARGRLAEVVGVDGERYTLAYDAADNLSTLTFPDLAQRSYLYNEPALMSGAILPHALTGIVDENGRRYASYGYDVHGRAISTEHAGGADRHVVAFDTDGNARVTDPLGATTIYGYGAVLAAARNTTVARPCAAPGCSGMDTASRQFNAQGMTVRYQDFNGNVTRYAYDAARNLETARTEADGTRLARTVLTTWHDVFRVPTRITEPTATGTRTTAFTYDAFGNLTAKSVSAEGMTRSWGWRYDDLGRLVSFTDPRGAVTRYVYYPNTAEQDNLSKGSRGMLYQIVDALGHVTTATAYGPHGWPTAVTDANGLTITMEYDARQRLTARAVGNEITRYDYDATGQLTQVTLPHGAWLRYGYDDAHRLVRIEDARGNRLLYTLDAKGNRVREEYRDPDGSLARTRSREYDSLDRLRREIGGSNPAAQMTQYAYDANGNQTAMTDPLGRVASRSYDGLNRLVQMIDPANGAVAPTNYEYDVRDNLVQTVDPAGLTATYAYNGFDELVRRHSLDIGIATYGYDAAGNLTDYLDARGAKVSLDYDGLNRPVRVDYSAYQSYPAESVTYQYDGAWGQCAGGIGRLCAITDRTGVTRYAYDADGRVSQKSYQPSTAPATPSSALLAASYSYHPGGMLAGIVTPGGNVIRYQLSQGMVSAITVNGATLLDQAIHDPFGPVGGWRWGGGTVNNVRTYLRRYDLDYRVTGWLSEIGGNGKSPSNPGQAVTWDDAGRVLGIVSNGFVNGSQAIGYGYDKLDRLIAAFDGDNSGVSGGGALFAYRYDGSGNRLAMKSALGESTYRYAMGAHRLQEISGAQTRSYQYDGAGNLSGEHSAAASQTFLYGADNRLREVKSASGTVAAYEVDARGQRVAKHAGGRGTRFFYDESGRLMGEYDLDGRMRQEYVWMGDWLVAVLRPSDTKGAVQIYHVHPDHLGAPRLITRADDAAVVWRWPNTDPFGGNPPDEDPSGLGRFEFNLRFPGQYHDSETNSAYNGHRDYDPATGRYRQPDPLGLAGDFEIYAYSSAAPMMFFDEPGLEPISLEEGRRIAKRASQWAKSGVRYTLGGASLSGADCSGATWAIYRDAGFSFKRSPTATFIKDNVRNGQFVAVSRPQPGDVVLWPGHIAIYDGSAELSCDCRLKSGSDMWTAFRTGGPVYGAANVATWRKDAPNFFRYNKPDEADAFGTGTYFRNLSNWIF